MFLPVTMHLLEGFWETVKVFALTLLFSLPLGLVICFGSMSRFTPLRKAVRTFVWIIRGTPLMLQLMAFFYGPGLMFGVLPKIFATMPGGTVIGTVFFLMVLLAALTSSISLMETVVSTVQDKWGLGRRLTCLIVLGISLLLGIPSCLGYSAWSSVKILGMQFLDLFDFISNSVIMPFVALFTAIFVGYVLSPKAVIDEVELSGKFKQKALFSAMIRYVAPVCILLILVSSVLSAFGVVKI